jgi:hypothetical protein
MIILFFTENNESFIANHDDVLTDLLYIKNDDMFNSGMRYMSVSDFSDLLNQIRTLLVNKILEYSKNCQTMDGYSGLEKNQLSLKCYTSDEELEEDLILNISKYIINFLKSRYNITVNPYSILGDMMSHLNLMEDVLYPLMYSDIYTLHGEQYFTKEKVIEDVYYNLKLKDLLQTVLTRRGILVVIDHDDDKIE